VGNCLPGRLKLKPESFMTIFLYPDFHVSPGLRAIYVDWSGHRNAARHRDSPGEASRFLPSKRPLISSIEWPRSVSMDIVSPESTTTWFFRGSSHPIARLDRREHMVFACGFLFRPLFPQGTFACAPVHTELQQS